MRINKKKKALALSMISIMAMMTLSGCQVLIEEEEVEANPPVATEAECSNSYYIWHNDKTDNIMDDLGGRNSGTAEFTKVYINHHTIESKEKYSNNVMGMPQRLAWFTDEELNLIPTYYPGDKLILNADTYLPEEITFERYFDEGWTFGITGLTEDGTGRYGRSTRIENKKLSYFFPLSDAYEVLKALPDTDIKIDKVGGQELRSNAISDSGFVMGLSKGKTYNVEIYVGTQSYDIRLKADSKPLVSRECFTSTDYSLVDTQTAVINLPSYLKTGYYYVDGEGFFRYIANGKSWNESTNFNTPICTFDSEGKLTYDPMGITTADTSSNTLKAPSYKSANNTSRSSTSSSSPSPVIVTSDVSTATKYNSTGLLNKDGYYETEEDLGGASEGNDLD